MSLGRTVLLTTHYLKEADALLDRIVVMDHGAVIAHGTPTEIINIIYLPMAFLSGLFIPAEMLPRFLQGFAVALPPYHLAGLALESVGVEPASNALEHIAAPIGFGALFTLIALVAYRRDDGKMYG